MKQIIIINKFHLFQMGSICICNTHTIHHPLTKMLEKALQKTSILIDDIRQIPKINLLIASQKNDYITLENCIVIFQTSETDQKEINSDKDRLIIKQKSNPEKGIIVYKLGYYIGNIAHDRAHGLNGVMYISQEVIDKNDREIVRLIIKGQWQNDKFLKGQFYNREERQILKLSCNNILNTMNIKLNQGPIESYIGQGSFTGPISNFAEAINGMGAIYFRDGSIYSGMIKNGIMDGEGEFISANKEERYKGKYVNGVRHGEKAKMEVKYEDGIQCKYTIDWQNGKPNIDSLEMQSRDPRQTIFRVRETN